MSDRTFKIDQPFMSGADVKLWQQEVRRQFLMMGIDYPLKADGTYGLASRSATASLLHSLGMEAGEQMKDGVTPELRVRVRTRKLTDEEGKAMVARVDYRRALRDRYESSTKIALPVAKIIEASWGFHPPGHDGLDVICPPNAVLHAMMDGVITRADNFGWWGKAPSGNIALGDGICIVQSTADVGPLKKGHCLGYGHAEKNMHKVGDKVEAGEPIAHAGLAVAWHIHLMWNKGSFDKTKGRGDGDPLVVLDYARKHA